uniref:Amino acid adenylation domain-containing protein n=1 Tax=Candidatus Kentrum sp. LFY TaxID=2126342 RepID=A0A450WSR1_9GAMM|nr:MAG: amino acid adenylation domain-containing protein [Candidatus Kentron sp. LFY]
MSKDSHQAATLIELLQYGTHTQPDKRVYTFLKDGEIEEGNLTYAQLDRQARAIAARLQDITTPGERVLLLYPAGLEFIAAFFGCLYAGVVAVPTYPPRRNRPDPRFQAIAADAQASAVLTTTEILSEQDSRLTETPELRNLHWLATDDLAMETASSWQMPDINGDTLAFLQYTSGSTGSPKGVMVSHGNVLYNAEMFRQTFGHTENTIGVGWLPLFHDMGLIGYVFQPLYAGFSVVLMSPLAFLQRPFRWLQAISRYRATSCAGPNFAYDLCVEKTTPEQRAELDLSCWETAGNGAEPIRAETLERFAKTFAPCGFHREAFYPCYGMAETTLIVSGGLKDKPPIVYEASLEQDRIVGASRLTRKFVGCGRTAWLDQEVIITDPETFIQYPDRQVGEIWVSGKHVAPGYWNRPEETQQTFETYLADTNEGPFLRTGDLGFMKDGELFVTGRLKDLIIIHGQNHYPQDIELTVEKSHPALVAGGGAAFSIDREGEERLVIFQEIQRTYLRKLDTEQVFGAIRQAILDQHEVAVHAIALLKPGRLPRTSSGKVQRHACRERFLAGKLNGVAEWRQAKIEIAPSEIIPLPTETCATEEAITDWLIARIGQLTAVPAQDIDPKRPFANLGLDSIAAVRLSGELGKRLGQPLSATLAYDYPTIDVLAQHVANTPPSTPLQAGQLKISNPLSYGQQALWFLYRNAPESFAYNVAAVVRILSPVDVPALRTIFRTLIARHPSLRSNFSEQDGQPMQIIHDYQDVRFEEIDTSQSTEEELHQRVIEAYQRPFDLEHGPVLRVSLFTQAQEKHVLLITMHHIVSDGWSMWMLMSEFLTLYPLSEFEQATALPPLQWQYPDFVRWQTELMESPEGEHLWQYWQEQLAGELPVLDLPTDHPRLPVLTNNGASITFTLPATLTQELKEQAQASGATLYMILLAAFQVLLHRYTGQEDILVGSPTAGRSRNEFEGICGYFINPIVLRARLEGNQSFRSFLNQVRQTVLEGLAHQDYPFLLLLRRLQLRWDASRPPLSQVFFILQQSQRDDELSTFFLGLDDEDLRIDRGGHSLTPFKMVQQEGQSELTLEMIESKRSLSGALKYNTDLFEIETIERMVEQFRRLLGGIVTEPETSIAELPLLTEAEKRRILIEWNNTKVPYSQDKCVHELFEEQVVRSPDAVAVVFEDEEVSYGEVNARANRLAHRLRELGVGPEVLVGLFVERSVEMIVGLLAILKAGGAYMPLDPSWPVQRLVFMAKDADLAVLLCHGATKDRLPECSAQIVELDGITEIAGESSNNPTRLVTSENLAYVVYTSGSTGNPKGVCIKHKNVSNFLHSMGREPGFSAQDVLLSVTTISFDISALEFFLPIIFGGRLVVTGEADAWDGYTLAELIDKHNVTFLQATPATWRSLEAENWRCCANIKALCGGEPLPVDLANSLSRNVSTLWNMYGPTETTIWSLVKKVLPEKPVSIGYPIANTQVYILDSQMCPLPVGVSGELYIGGAGVAHGYLNRPDLTAKKFIPDPFSDNPNARMYRTGDSCRWLSDGTIEFLGRIDTQVKIRGFRIECGEVENTLLTYPGIREAVVDARGEGTDKRLVAWVVSTDVGCGEERTASMNPNAIDAVRFSPHPTQSLRDALRSHLTRTLPNWMVPSVFVFVEALPLTPSGKIDRKVLPNPERKNLGTGKYVAPQNSIEKTIAKIWCGLLGIEQVGVHDNFFDMGGHSLLITQLRSKLPVVFGKGITTVELFQHPTIHALAQYFGQESVKQTTRNRADERRHSRRVSAGKQRQTRQGHRASQR